MKFFLLLAFLVVLAAAVIPTSSSALLKPIELNLDYPEFGNITLDKQTCEGIEAGTVPGKVCGQNPDALIAWVYYFIVGIAGLAAFVMLVWGGVQWLTSGAIPSQASEARDKIRNAILGLLLVLVSFLVIQIINPELTILDVPGFGQGIGQTPALPAVPTGVNFFVESSGQKAENPRPGETLELLWNPFPDTRINDCVTNSYPSVVNWGGERKSVLGGTESIAFPTLGNFTLRLKCYWTTPTFEKEESVFISVTSSPAQPPLGPPKINNFAIAVGTGSFGETATGSDGSGDEVKFSWESVNTVQCTLSGHNSNITDIKENSSQASFSIGSLFGGAWFPRTYNYDLLCLSSNGQIAEDSVTLIVQ